MPTSWWPNCANYCRTPRVLANDLRLGKLAFGAVLALVSACAPQPMKSLDPSYSTGYEFGQALAKSRQKLTRVEVDAVFEGLCRALVETGTPIAGQRHCGPDAADQTAFPVMDDYAELNARREGVVVLASSVQYEVLRAGQGEVPAAGSRVRVNYLASLPDGTVFDTTYEDGEPLALDLDEIAIPGLREVLLMMPVGGR